jgi:hypothetical protein
MNFTTNARRMRLALLFTGLLLAPALAGCAAPSTSSQPTAAPPTAVSAPTSMPPTAVPTAMPPTAAPAPTGVPVPTSAPAPTAAPPATQPASTDTTGAVQTVLNYYDAITQKQFDRAYGYWANNGAASNQTLDQFKQGFANTAGVDLRLGSPAAQGADVAVPVTLAAVLNSPSGGDQSVQHFSGTYTLRPDSNSDTGWRIAAANIAEGPSSPPAPPTADPNGAVQAMQEYYDAINRHEFARAYTLWANLGTASQQSYAQFTQGYATTTRVTIDLGASTGGGAAGSIYAEVPIVILATTSDQGQQTFCGTYTLRRTNVPPFDQFGWHIQSAKIAPVANVQPGSAEEQQLLTGGCKAA